MKPVPGRHAESGFNLEGQFERRALLALQQFGGIAPADLAAAMELAGLQVRDARWF